MDMPASLETLGLYSRDSHSSVSRHFLSFYSAVKACSVFSETDVFSVAIPRSVRAYMHAVFTVKAVIPGNSSLSMLY